MSKNPSSKNKNPKPSLPKEQKQILGRVLDDMLDGLGFDHKTFTRQLTQQPGVYQMFDKEGKILYIGKAKNLKKRVSSYFRSSGLSKKTAALVSRIASIDVTVAPSEAEALVLEHNLIKSEKPPFNILLRDDKSYPYVFVSGDEKHPRISLHRGAKKKKGQYYGPYPNVGAVRESLNFLQKTFGVRQCEDSVYKNRSRPCLLHQIGRCSAPCVEFISDKQYQIDLKHTEMFLAGKSDALHKTLSKDMEEASSKLDFERAAQLRDRLSALRQVQAQQAIESGASNLDVVACETSGGHACVHILFVRQGRVLGSRSYFPKDRLSSDEGDIITAFLAHTYFGGAQMDLPSTVIVSHSLADADTLTTAIEVKTGRKVQISSNVRTYRARWLAMALETARQNLRSRLSTQQNTRECFEQLADIIGLDDINRIECFDISHSSGESTQASCVVWNQSGALTSDYRRFNIADVKAGDDYAAMSQVINRRYLRLQTEGSRLPELVLIDGGRGQVNAAINILSDLGIASTFVLGVAKGRSRKPGFETLIFQDGRELALNEAHPVLHLLQQIRDEAHRFAITGHRQRRDKRRQTSVLQAIPGIGPKRRRELLNFFGGYQEVHRASIEDLARVPGISKKLAREVYSVLHTE